MGGQQSTQAVRAVRAEDVRDFLELHCELSPDNHVALDELTGALHVFLETRQYKTRELLWTRELIDLFVNGYGFEFAGIVLPTPSPWRQVIVCGLRIKRFPRRGVPPQRIEAEFVCKLYKFLHKSRPALHDDESTFLENYELKKAASGGTEIKRD